MASVGNVRHVAQDRRARIATAALFLTNGAIFANMLPRYPEQADSLRKAWPTLFASGRMLIPEHVVDGLNLIWYSDLVISGGGTMNREAAALRVPVYSIFRGKIGAVDQYLSNCGRLILLESVEQVFKRIVIARHTRPVKPQHATSATLQAVVGHILKVLEVTGGPLI